MALEKIKEARGTAVAIMADDIDTDRIIPARFLKAVTFDGMGAGLFIDERFDEQGNSKGHQLDDPRYAGAAIMISGDNFGCGSSREHAPQAIQRAGFRGIIAGSFAEIFFGNSTTLGLVCAVLGQEEREQLANAVKADPKIEVVIDLEAREVRASGSGFDRVYPAGFRESAREALLTGYWDPIGELLENVPAVRATAKALGHSEVPA